MQGYSWIGSHRPSSIVHLARKGSSALEALVKYDNIPGCVEIREMPAPEIAPDQVLLRVHAVGICGSDLEMYHHKVTFEVSPPVILGHEFSGTVAEVGASVHGFRP